jgi:hypothetical protein
LGDLIGLHIAMTKIAGKCEIKYLVAGVGWASAELITTKYVRLKFSVIFMKIFKSFLQ